MGHARRVGCEDRPLVHYPGCGRIRLPQLLDHLDVRRQVDLAAADGVRDRHVKEPGVGNGLEARARQERWLSGTLWRAGQTLRITVEQPYLPSKREASETAPEAASPGDGAAHASAQTG